MTVTFSNSEFRQDTGRAQKAAETGPVFITDGGKLAHVLLSIEEYNKLTSREPTIVDLLAMPDAAEIEFELPKRRTSKTRIPDFS